MVHDPTHLPESLPRPLDDGAADNLAGSAFPDVALPSTAGGFVNLRERSQSSRVVVFAFPRTGRPGVELPTGWDDIPGARGCTPEACGFRDQASEFAALGAEVYGLSTQDTDYQEEAATRLRLTYPLLSDAALELTREMRLPTFDVDGMTLLRRLTMVVEDGRVTQVLYPVFPPDQAASEALAVLARSQRAS